MTTELEFFTNPMSRDQIVRWMLEEVGQPYKTHLLDFATSMKAADYLAVNPMGKVPAIRHDGAVLTEVAAICAYLADAFPDAGLAPPIDRRGDYYRWLFFAAGPVEAAFSNKAAGFEPPPERRALFGYGTFDLTINTLEQAVARNDFIAGDRFSAADLYVGSEIGFMLQFGLLEPRPAFSDYVARVTDRPAYARAKQIDADLIAAITPAQPPEE
ncbi:MAG: glutathione S-transferase family protein [Pseudomonadota bacterium]|nr:glutathione S-transferase family protein [Pseudomonadota bacterium]